MPVYRDKQGRRGRWRVVVHHKGRRLERAVRGTKKDAESFEARWRVELAAREPAAHRTAPTFSDFCVSSYRPWAEVHLVPRTWQNRRYQLATLIEHFGSRKMDAVTAADVDAYKQSRVAAGIKASTVNDDLKVLRAVFGLAVELGVPVTVPRIRRLPEKGRGRVQVWSEEQVQRLYASCLDTAVDILPLVVYLINTGCRKGEALALRWQSVDLDRGLLEIHPYEGWQPKNGRPREVPISTGLRPWLEQAERLGDYVFTTGAGGRYAYWPQRKFDRARSAAGLEGGPHTARHTFASHFLARCPDLFLLAAILGHSHQRVTELYAHLLPDHLERARDAVDIAPTMSPADWFARMERP